MYKQLSLFAENEPQTSIEDVLTRKNLGTFKDSLKAPIHRWFKYPAGYSYRFVETFLSAHNLDTSAWVLDPFVGSGTTTLAAKQYGVNSVGIEAHPFVHWVAQVKCFWEYDVDSLRRRIKELLSHLEVIPTYPGSDAIQEFPELIHKCFSPENLWRLKFIRDAIENFPAPQEERDLFKLALTDTLRTSSSAGSGWPYIAPSKYHEKTERPALEVFSRTLYEMYSDICKVREIQRQGVATQVLRWDARNEYPLCPESVDLAITSPPYLNNYDYADRTRLEMYFFGLAQSWGDITRQVRDKLIIAATTQIKREKFDDAPLAPLLKEVEPALHQELLEKIRSLSIQRLTKGGKKSYDLMVAGYFNDMLSVLIQVHRVLKPGSSFVLMLGDSAPYGVHIPTEEYLGRLAVAVGFDDFYVHNLRKRGEKWKNNPQRHNVLLKEGILILQRSSRTSIS